MSNAGFIVIACSLIGQCKICWQHRDFKISQANGNAKLTLHLSQVAEIPLGAYNAWAPKN